MNIQQPLSSETINTGISQVIRRNMIQKPS